MGIASGTIQKIKALSVSEVLAADGCSLKKVGREFVTRCLWHSDTNPSLTINDDKGFVFCHVCQHHDDAIGYIQQKYGISFVDACERIANSHGIPVEKTDEDPAAIAKYKKEREVAYAKVEKQQVKFKTDLRQTPEAIAFLQSRNIEPQTSRDFGIGYDAYSSRITVPISNHLGKHVGFTARTIKNDVKPKYKNTENNQIFVKNEIVFNEYRAAEAIRQKDECVFVEGHLDVVSLWQAGVKNVVALQGTASPSETVLKRLMRKTKRFVLCMDADQGGLKAISKFLDSVKGYTLAGELDVRIAKLPDGMDPDDFIQQGNSIQTVVDDAVTWLDWILDQWLNTLDFKDELKIQEVEKQIKDLFSQIASPALRSHYYDKASLRLAQNKQDVAAQIAKGFHDFKSNKIQLKLWKRPEADYTRKLVEKRMLRLYIHKPEYRWILSPMMDRLHLPETKWLWRRLQELEQYIGPDFCSHSVLAILCIAESVYMNSLRSLANPTIAVDDDELSIAHIEEVMMKSVVEPVAA